MTMKYDLSHVNQMSWGEFHDIVRDIIQRLQQTGIQFDACAPMLRSGAIPGTMIANKLKIIPVIPLQVKYNYNDHCVDTIIKPTVPNGLDVNKVGNILVTECNTYMGTSAFLVRNLLKSAFPNAKLHYVCVTKVFGGPQVIDGYDTYIWGKLTNEAFKVNAPADARSGITIYPWETPEYELDDINAC
jgi:hypoxanthine phosphoribosyltransferase